MSASKEKLPWGLKQRVLGIVKDYDRMRAEYKARRMDILDAGGGHYSTYVVNGEERRAYMPSAHNASRTTEDKQLQLDGLEQTLLVRQLRAVEHASARIGKDLPGPMQDQLREALMLNCTDGRKFPFERLFVTGVSRSEFYERKDAFLLAIYEELQPF